MTSPGKRRYIALVAAAALVVLFWILSFADPCLIAIWGGGPGPSANPIAITECYINEAGRVVITNGDAIIRLAALALLMGLFGLICRLLDPGRRKRSFAGIAAAGATCAFAIYPAGQFVLFGNVSLYWVHLQMWVACMIVASLSVMAGAGLAATTEPSEI